MNSGTTKKRQYLLGPCALVFTSGKTGAWRVVRPRVDKELCILCGICEKYCPTNIIDVIKKKQPNEGVHFDFDYCKGCGICANECPKQAISMIPEREA